MNLLEFYARSKTDWVSRRIDYIGRKYIIQTFIE